MKLLFLFNSENSAIHSYLYNKYHNYTTAHPAVPAQAFNKKHKYATAHPAVPAQASQQKSGEVKPPLLAK